MDIPDESTKTDPLIFSLFTSNSGESGGRNQANAIHAVTNRNIKAHPNRPSIKLYIEDGIRKTTLTRNHTKINTTV